LPVTVDIEGGYGQDPKEILNYIEEVIKTGIVGINIEDSKNTSPELIDENEFGERITAIRQLSDSLGIHLVINARTDVFLAQSGAPESRLSESIKRGNRYILAGADCIFVPNVWETDKIAVLTLEINGPVNILANPTNGTEMPPSVSELKKLGVARLSVGSALMKSTLALIKKTADEVIQSGTYNNFTSSLMPIEETVDAYNMAVGITKP
jgi:2-methylisocitrate lyase-like PEP mutase family enzyme